MFIDAYKKSVIGITKNVKPNDVLHGFVQFKRHVGRCLNKTMMPTNLLLAMPTTAWRMREEGREGGGKRGREKINRMCQDNL